MPPAGDMPEKGVNIYLQLRGLAVAPAAVPRGLCRVSAQSGTARLQPSMVLLLRLPSPSCVMPQGRTEGARALAGEAFSAAKDKYHPIARKMVEADLAS